MRLRLNFLVLIAALACTGCEQAGVATGWSNTIASTPKPQVTIVPSATGQPTQQMQTPSSTQLPPSEPLVTSQFPRDAKGRFIGGATFPILNYSPTMIAAPFGKPCPRVSHWEFDVITLTAPLKSFGVSKDPCVVQNAVDDLVGTIQFYPAFQSPQTMPEIAKAYDTDPANLCCVEKTLRESMIQAWRNGEGAYHVCDKPVFHLLAVDAHAPLIADNDGRVSGRVIQIMLVRVAKGMQPFECQFVRYKDGQTRGGKFAVNDDMVAGKVDAPAIIYNLRWNSRTHHWVLYSVGIAKLDYRKKWIGR